MSNYNICGDVSIISADDSVVDDDDALHKSEYSFYDVYYELINISSMVKHLL